MSDSGNNWFDYFKDRRFAPVFLITLAVLSGITVGASIFAPNISMADWLKYWPVITTVLGGCLAVSILHSVMQARARRRDRYKLSPLSRDELRKARSKLVKQK